MSCPRPPYQDGLGYAVNTRCPPPRPVLRDNFSSLTNIYFSLASHVLIGQLVCPPCDLQSRPLRAVAGFTAERKEKDGNPQASS